LDVLPYFASLLECCRIPQKPVHSRLLNALLSFLFCAFGLKLTLTLLVFQFRLSPNAPLIAMQDVLAVLISAVSSTWIAMSVICASSF
jgi:hypothetical protein